MKRKISNQLSGEPQLASTPRRVRAALRYVAMLPLALFVTGCTVLSYTGPNGERFSRGSLGTATAIASLSVETGTNGVRRVELQGYQNDAAQAFGAVTEAAVRAAIQSRP